MQKRRNRDKNNTPDTAEIASRVASGASPSERGRNYTPPKGGALRPAGGFLQKADDFPTASLLPSIITGDATLPLRWLPPATPL